MWLDSKAVNCPQKWGNFNQWFTSELGHPKLKEHLAAVTALMRAAPNWEAFKRSLVRAFPKPKEQTPFGVAEN